MLLRVHGAGFERGVEFGERHWYRVGAQEFKRLDVHRVLVGADFQSLDVVRGFHRVFGVGDGAEADFPEAQSFQALVFEFFHQPLADVAVQDAVGVCLVAEDEGDVDDVEVGNQTGEVW